jgi:nucleoside-diphosphate-sugar epimerase
MRIVISGASGFIGRHLAARLSSERPHDELLCLAKPNDDAFGHSGLSYLQSQNIPVQFAELVSGDGLHGLPRPDILFHLAANTHTWERDQRCNDIGTINLIDSLRPLGGRTHVIFTSTVAVMDNRPDMHVPLRSDLDFNADPLSDYGARKLRAEQFLMQQARQQHFGLTILRLCTVYGPEVKPNSFFDVLQREVVCRSWKSRLNWPAQTGFVHVGDVVECLIHVAANPPDPGTCRIHVVATESATLQDVSRLLYESHSETFNPIRLPRFVWRVLSRSHALCARTRRLLASELYNQLWRFDLFSTVTQTPRSQLSLACAQGASAISSGNFRSIVLLLVKLVQRLESAMDLQALVDIVHVLSHGPDAQLFVICNFLVLQSLVQQLRDLPLSFRQQGPIWRARQLRAAV